jgi:hypothetical protein
MLAFETAQKWSNIHQGESKVAELRMQIPEELVRKLQAKLGHDVKVTDIAREALTLFNWAVQEKAKGRQILSSNEEGEEVKVLAMASLENMPGQPGDKTR